MFGYGAGPAGGQVSDPAQPVFNTSEFFAPYTSSLTLTRGTGVTTPTRATAQTFTDHEGVLRTAPSGVIAIEGGRMVRNLLTSTATLSTQNVTTVAGDYTLSFSGTGSVDLTGTVTDSLAGTGADDRVELTFTATAGTLTLTVTGSVTSAQLEDVTGQSIQTAGEYVSVGALDYRSDADPLFLSLPGTAGHYASTPDSVAASITGDIDIRVKVALTDWTPATLSTLAARYVGGGSRAYLFGVNAAGTLRLITSADGTALIDRSSTASVSAANLDTVFVRVTLDVDNDAVGNTAVFYTSTDGESWVQLGDPVVNAGTTSIFDGAMSLEVGSDGSGATDRVNGRIYSAQIYDGIDGTLVVDFNPHRDAVTPTGTITSSTTSEVWTINGASSVVRNQNYQGAGADGVEYQPNDLSGNPITPDGIAIWPAATEYLGVTATPATQTTASLGTGTYTLWCEGTGSCIASAGTATISGEAAASEDTPNTFSVTGAGTVTVTVTGSLTTFNLTNTAYQHPYIANTGAAGTSATRNAGILSAPTAGNISETAGTIAFEFTPGHAPSGTVYLWGSYEDANNSTSILHDGTNLIFRRRVLGNYDATIANAFVAGTTYKVAASWGASGIKIALDGTLGTPEATVLNLHTGATMELVSDGNGANQAGMAFKLNYILQRQVSDEELLAMTR